jgi:hypothetical protein
VEPRALLALVQARLRMAILLDELRGADRTARIAGFVERALPLLVEEQQLFAAIASRQVPVREPFGGGMSVGVEIRSEVITREVVAERRPDGSVVRRVRRIQPSQGMQGLVLADQFNAVADALPDELRGWARAFLRTLEV